MVLRIICTFCNNQSNINNFSDLVPCSVCSSFIYSILSINSDDQTTFRTISTD